MADHISTITPTDFPETNGSFPSSVGVRNDNVLVDTYLGKPNDDNKQHDTENNAPENTQVKGDHWNDTDMASPIPGIHNDEQFQQTQYTVLSQQGSPALSIREEETGDAVPPSTQGNKQVRFNENVKVINEKKSSRVDSASDSTAVESDTESEIEQPPPILEKDGPPADPVRARVMKLVQEPESLLFVLNGGEVTGIQRTQTLSGKTEIRTGSALQKLWEGPERPPDSLSEGFTVVIDTNTGDLNDLQGGTPPEGENTSTLGPDGAPEPDLPLRNDSLTNNPEETGRSYVVENGEIVPIGEKADEQNVWENREEGRTFTKGYIPSDSESGNSQVREVQAKDENGYQSLNNGQFREKNRVPGGDSDPAARDNVIVEPEQRSIGRFVNKPNWEGHPNPFGSDVPPIRGDVGTTASSAIETPPLADRTAAMQDKLMLGFAVSAALLPVVVAAGLAIYEKVEGEI